MVTRGTSSAPNVLMTDVLERVDELQLDLVCGGADDPMGPTVLVAGRPQTRQAIIARGDRLFGRAYDPTMSNEAWLREWKRLNKAWQRLPLSAAEQNS